MVTNITLEKNVDNTLIEKRIEELRKQVELNMVLALGFVRQGHYNIAIRHNEDAYTLLAQLMQLDI